MGLQLHGLGMVACSTRRGGRGVHEQADAADLDDQSVGLGARQTPLEARDHRAARARA